MHFNLIFMYSKIWNLFYILFRDFLVFFACLFLVCKTKILSHAEVCVFSVCPEPTRQRQAALWCRGQTGGSHQEPSSLPVQVPQNLWILSCFKEPYLCICRKVTCLNRMVTWLDRKASCLNKKVPVQTGRLLVWTGR